MKNSISNRKPYFDPVIFEKVLEDVYLSPIAKEILNSRSEYKQNFLFPYVREKFIPQIEERVKFIERAVKDETLYQLFYEYNEYIKHKEEDKQRWYNELREQYGLPSDYEFEI